MRRRIAWYYSRFRSMSLNEMVFRANKVIQNYKEKLTLDTGLLVPKSFESVFLESIAQLDTKQKMPEEFSAKFSKFNHIDVFGSPVNFYDPIDWHLDIISGKRFPDKYARDIEIRSEKYGSAKVVWEINRLQFLLPLAVKYVNNRDPKDIACFINIIKSWTSENPYLRGVNWHSNIEVNLRLIVWYFCWQILLADDELRNDQAFIQFAQSVWLPTIYDHCRYSYNNPSKFSSANNHLIAEYTGLFIAANCWPFKQAESWKAYAKKGLEKEIVLQHSEGGINKEEAAEYIQFITDFFLIAYAVGESKGDRFSDTYRRYLKSIFQYVDNLLDISGGYAKYGDEDDGKLLISDDNAFNNFKSLLISAAVIFKDSKFKRSESNFDLKNWLLWGREGYFLYKSLPVENNTSVMSIF